MSVVAIGLIVLAAVMHAGWNALAKGRRDILAFFYGLTLAALVIYLVPFAIVVAKHPPTWRGTPFFVASGFTHVAYYSGLALAYRRSDLSLAYPVARGTGVLLVPLLAMPIFGDRPTLVAWLGIGMVLAGVVTLHLPALCRLRSGGLALAAPAVVTGIVIATYSLIDSAGVKRIEPFVYLYLTFAVIAVAMAPYILTRKRAALIAEFRGGWPVWAGGAAVFGTYGIILAAMKLAPVSYVVPMRELSIVFGALIAMRFLGEPAERNRLLACLGVAAGVIAIGIGG
jgi:drug/metabolite transporter (DMT)-like permease